MGKEKSQAFRFRAFEGPVPQAWAAFYRLCEKVLFPAILLLYPLRHIRYGVEWWDTGYNYGNFLFMDRMDPMWVFSTYLGNALGHLFTKLPFGNRMLGLNVYTALLVILLALSGYYFFTKKGKLPAWIAFLGELLALNLCWCPTALLYNYLTYVLFGAGVMALYCALTEEKNCYFVVAGIALGVNVFVRFPNLAEMGLIVGVWAYGVIRKKKFLCILQETSWCVLGYAAGALLCLGYLSLRYGLGEYVSAIQRLLAMPAEASGYTPVSMVLSQIENYRHNLTYAGYLLLFTALGVLGFAVLPERLVKLKKLGYTVCVFLGFYFLMMRRNMFNLRYTTKESVFQWGALFLTVTIVLGLVTIFRKKAEPQDKLMLGMGILIILITPLGSNNHLYSSINNLFFVAPYTLWVLYRLLRALPQEWKLPQNLFQRLPALGKLSKFRIFTFPAKAMILSALLVLFVQSMGFGLVYVFSESGGGENLHTAIEGNDTLKGMYTSPDRARVLSSLYGYVEERGLEGHDIIVYGGSVSGWIPSLPYYLNMPFAITSWPEMASYNLSVLEADLAKLTEEIGAGEREVPAVLLEAGLREQLEEELGQIVLGEGASQEDRDAKTEALFAWMKGYSYRVVFENEKFILLLGEI